MNSTLLTVCISNLPSFGVGDSLYGLGVSAFHANIFLVAVLLIWSIWILFQLFTWFLARRADKKRASRRCRLGMNPRFQKSAPKVAQQLRMSVLISAIVACGTWILAMNQSEETKKTTTIAQFDFNNKLEELKEVVVEESTSNKSEYIEALSSLEEAVTRQTIVLESFVENSEKRLRSMREVTSANLKEPKIILSSGAAVTAPDETEAVEYELETEFKKAGEETSSDKFVFVPFVGSANESNVKCDPMQSVALSDDNRSRFTTQVAQQLPLAQEEKSSVYQDEPSRPSGLNIVSRSNLTSDFSVVRSSELTDEYFARNNTNNSYTSFADRFAPRQNVRFQSDAAKISNRAGIRSTGVTESDDVQKERLIDYYSWEETKSENGRNSRKSILEAIDEESNRISSLVRSCVLPIETKKNVKRNGVLNVEEETGCGFLTQYQGRTYVITNYHVVSNALSNDSIKIFVSSSHSIAPLKVYTCSDFDLAALEISANELPTDGSVTYCRFGDSDTLSVANSIFAIGNPFGLEKSVTYGHVSSLCRSNKDLISSSQNSLPEYIQLDAAINPGNSGGPLYNARGEVVGVVTAIATTSGKNEGVAFAIPSNIALQVVKHMIDEDGWRRSRLGVELSSVSQEELASTSLSSVFGAKITKVERRSPADNSGLHVGDIVLVFNGQRVSDDLHFARLVALAGTSNRSKLGVLRDGQFFEVETSLICSQTKPFQIDK